MGEWNPSPQADIIITVFFAWQTCYFIILLLVSQGYLIFEKERIWKFLGEPPPPSGPNIMFYCWIRQYYKKARAQNIEIWPNAMAHIWKNWFLGDFEHILNLFSTGPDDASQWQRATFFLFFLQGTSFGLAKTNHALLSLVGTNLVQYTIHMDLYQQLTKIWKNKKMTTRHETNFVWNGSSGTCQMASLESL